MAETVQHLQQVHWLLTLFQMQLFLFTREHLDLLKPAERKLVEDFRKAKELPDSFSAPFVTALQQALSGLSRVPVSPQKLFAKLFPSGTPATVEEMKERFAAFAEELLRGQDRSKVRLVPEATSTTAE
jgi:hypothetical protein